MTALTTLHTRIVRPAPGTGAGAPLEGWAPQLDWTGAACRGHDPELWFPMPTQDASKAQAICAGCPIRRACLAHGQAVEKTGIWGGIRRG